MAYSPNNRFIPQALITVLFSLPGVILYTQGYYLMVVFYFVAVLYIFANGLSNMRYYADIEPLNTKSLKDFLTAIFRKK